MLLVGLLLVALTLEICIVGINSAEVQVQVVTVEVAVVDHFPVVSSLSLVQDGSLNRVRILYNSVILIRLQVGAIENMLHCFVLSLHVGLPSVRIALDIADLVVGVREVVTLLPLLLCLLVMQEALQVILQLVVHFIPSAFHVIRADEREVGQVLHSLSCVALAL